MVYPPDHQEQHHTQEYGGLQQYPTFPPPQQYSSFPPPQQYNSAQQQADGRSSPRYTTGPEGQDTGLNENSEGEEGERGLVTHIVGAKVVCRSIGSCW